MAIWDDWEMHYRQLGLDARNICKDGIVDEEEFGKVNRRVLFVLKETNDAPGLDLREFLAQGPKYGCWHVIARWAVGLLEGFPSHNEITIDRMKSALRRVAVINLKKLTGKEVADPSVVGAFALRDRRLLLQQIMEIQPHLIIGCGTFETLEWLLELDVEPNNPSGNPVRHAQTGAWVVPIRHPSRANSAHYEELKEKCSAIQ